MLSELQLEHTGPARGLRLDFAPRLNVITGDNGVGKSFILDVAWWALTRTWAGAPAQPTPVESGGVSLSKPAIEYEQRSWSGIERDRARFDHRAQAWEWLGSPNASSAGHSLVVYARVDGGYAVYDPLRGGITRGDDLSNGLLSRAYVFDRDEVWDGLYRSASKRPACNGLLADWVLWQRGDAHAYRQLTGILRHLSPGPDEPLEPGPPTRVSLDDSRDIPTLRTPYGLVPVTVASAGVRRILALAYLLVWAWREHREAARIVGESTLAEVVLIIDEVESHLHPRWQRVLLPALLEAVAGLSDRAAVQVIATTHAPLVLVSLEPHWDDSVDGLFLMDLEPLEGDPRRCQTVVRREEFTARGNPSYWLESDAFDRTPLRSEEAEIALAALRETIRVEPDNRDRARRQYERFARLVAPGDPVLIQIQGSLSARGIEV